MTVNVDSGNPGWVGASEAGRQPDIAFAHHAAVDDRLAGVEADRVRQLGRPCDVPQGEVGALAEGVFVSAIIVPAAGAPAAAAPAV